MWVTLEATGSEAGTYLSHSSGVVSLVSGKGDGEIFILEHISSNKVALACIGQERGKYLSHAFRTLWLQSWTNPARKRNSRPSCIWTTCV